MTIYKNQLPSSTIPFDQFIIDMNDDLRYNATLALIEYEGELPKSYDDYLVFFVDYTKDNEAIFAITRILDEWQPIEVNSKVRKFTQNKVWEKDSEIIIKVI